MELASPTIDHPTKDSIVFAKSNFSFTLMTPDKTAQESEPQSTPDKLTTLTEQDIATPEQRESLIREVMNMRIFTEAGRGHILIAFYDIAREAIRQIEHTLVRTDRSEVEKMGKEVKRIWTEALQSLPELIRERSIQELKNAADSNIHAKIIITEALSRLNIPEI